MQVVKNLQAAVAAFLGASQKKSLVFIIFLIISLFGQEKSINIAIYE